MGYYSNDRLEMLTYIPLESSRILEIGCGQGNFSALLKKRNNVEVWGVELSEDAAKKASSVLDKVIQGDLLGKRSLLPIKYFDCIVFNDVLEHFIDPWKVLTELKENLNEKGIIVASIPNVRYIGNLFELLIKKDWEYKIQGGILDITHYRFYTKKSIIRLFEESGYTVTALKGINPTPSIKVKLFSIFSFGYFSDVKFMEFATVARILK
jgi:2-polyprenyl-3-methyl-5-hydroxy-6-metoxy-1,4-benzoquinol methylase